MKFIFSLWRRMRATAQSEQIHDEISDELRFHVEMKTADLIRNGMPAHQAQIAAAKAFGSARRMEEQGYDVRGGGTLEEVWGDMRFAVRLLRKQWMKTAVLVATLAVGVGVNTAVFGVIRSVLLQPLPFRNSGELVVLHQANHGQAGGVSYPHYQDWRAGNHSFTDMAVYSGITATLTGAGEATTIPGAIVSHSLFRLLGVQPLRGRLFQAEEDRLPAGAGTSSPVLISDRLWRSRFGSRNDVLRQSVHLDGRVVHIIGVIPAPLAYPLQKDGVDFWVTVAVDADPALYGGSIPVSRGYPRYDGAIARLKPGVTLQGAGGEMNALAKNIAREHPNATPANEIAVVPALEEVVGSGSRTMLFVLYGAVFCVLAVACINVANILLVAAIGRRREFAVRTALGAPAFKLVRQLLIESAVLAVTGGFFSLLIAFAVLQLFPVLAPPEMPRLQDIHFHASVFFYVLGISLLSGLLFGCLPALSTRKYQLAAALKEGSRAVTKKASGLRPGPLLICGQITLSMILVCSATALSASFYKILHTTRGFNPHRLLTAAISLPAAQYPQSSARVSQFYNSLLSELRATPEVQAAAMSEVLPLSGRSNSTTVKIAGVSERGFQSTDLRFVDPAYFGTLQIPLLSGRFFSEWDRNGRPPVAVVNQAFTRRFLRGKDPYRSELLLGWGGGAPKRIVGVVGDIRHSAASSEAVPEVYVPFAQFPLNDMYILLRTVGEGGNAAASLRTVTHHLDPSVPVDSIRTLDDYLMLSAAPQQFLMWLFVVFALITLLLATVGLYGVLSETTSARTHEFGIRLALGASPRSLMTLVLRQGIGIALAGLALGGALAVFASRLLIHWLYETSPASVPIFALSGCILLFVTIAACLVPSRRAAATNPALSLRTD